MTKSDSQKNAVYSGESGSAGKLSDQYWRLEIHQGLHDGAKVDLNEESLVVVGSAHDCEIVLHDEGVAAHHFAVVVRQNTIVLKALDGIVNFNNSQLVDDQVDLLCTNTIWLENCDVEIKFNLIAKSGFDDNHRNASQTKTDEKLSQNKNNRVVQMVWMMATVLFLGLLVSSGGITVAGKKQTEMAYTDTDSLREILVTLKLDQQLTVVEIEQGQLIKGVLGTHERDNLERKLHKLSGQFLINTITPEQLLEQVGNVFRINGYTAKLQYQGGADVTVENLDGTLDEIQKIAAYIKQDVPSLLSLNFKKQIQQVPVVTPEYEIDPEKKMTTIIDGDIAYISTVDGARYFSGSVLPGGYTLKDITTNGVKVIKDNKVTWLNF